VTDRTTALSLEAPAKVNLDLRVLGRREDGHHLLESTVILLELADRLLLLPGCSGLRVDGAGSADIPIDATNLAWRGLIAGLDAEPDLTCLTLEKRIPSAAGLGGGSSDAAAAWRLGRAWRGAPEQPAAEDVTALAAIGADVPFFASGAPAAQVAGIGERVTPLPPAALEIVLVHPPLRLRTRDVFGELREEEWGRGANDLLPPALRLCPRIAELFEIVVAAGGEPRLTGSGPTVFAATEDPERARDIGSRLQRAGQSVTVTRSRRAGASIARITEEE
jgi:4-diphosphocytidyl-2-C-methyl-D-erythritol kinase